MKTLRCDWLAQIEKVTVKTEQKATTQKVEGIRLQI